MNPEADDRILTYRGVVYPWHCDHMGHMNVTWYTAKFDEATWNLFAALGITSTYIRNQNHGMAAVQQNIGYKRELTAGEIVVVRTRILEVREKVIRFLHEMSNDENNEIAATSEITAVHLDLINRRASPLPSEILGRARIRSASSVHH